MGAKTTKWHRKERQLRRTHQPWPSHHFFDRSKYELWLGFRRGKRKSSEWMRFSDPSLRVIFQKMSRQTHVEEILSTIAHLNLEGRISNPQGNAAEFGGTCDVFTAWSTLHNKKVAVKRVRVVLEGNESFAKVGIRGHSYPSIWRTVLLAILWGNSNLGKPRAWERPPAAWFHSRRLFKLAEPNFWMDGLWRFAQVHGNVRSGKCRHMHNGS